MLPVHVISLACVRTQQVHDQAYVRTVAERRADHGELVNHVETTDARRIHNGSSG